MSEDRRNRIPDFTVLIRGIGKRDIHKETRKIKKGAFIPRRNGKDDDGLSISQPLSDSYAQLAVRIQPQEGHYCTLSAGQIRAINVAEIKLEVCPDPTERDPYHTLIKNVPTDPENAAVATRLAQLLAEASIEYIPPAKE